MSEYYQIFIKKKPRHELFKAVLVDEYLFDWHVKEISYIHCKFKRWSASAVLNGADRLSRYSKLFYQITLPYLFLFSDLREIILHMYPWSLHAEHLCNYISILYHLIIMCQVFFTLTIIVQRKNPSHLRQVFVVLRPGIEPGTRGFSVPCSTYWATWA